MPESAGRTILIIEDDPQLLKLIRTILNGGGYRVLEARNHNQAAAVAGEKPVDLVIIGAPPRHPEHLRSGRKVLLLSHGPGAGSGIRVLQKPFTPAALLATVGEILG